MDTNRSRRELGKKPITVYLTEQVRLAMKRARGYDRKQSEWVEEAIREKLDRYDPTWNRPASTATRATKSTGGRK